MTQVIETPGGGRERGLMGLLRAFVEVIVRPGSFFRQGVAPGQQAPGLLFVMSVVLAQEIVRLTVSSVPIPLLFDSLTVTAFVWLATLVFVLTPVLLHVMAALSTVLLMATFVRDRAGVSETVQVLAYATAPCIVAGVPADVWVDLGGELALLVPTAAAVYAVVLVVYGLATVHRTTPTKAAIAGLVPATFVVAVGFRMYEPVGELLRHWYII